MIQLTGHVTETIENAKKKIADMPHAKKELNPLWGLLSGMFNSQNFAAWIRN